MMDAEKMAAAGQWPDNNNNINIQQQQPAPTSFSSGQQGPVYLDLSALCYQL